MLRVQRAAGAEDREGRLGRAVALAPQLREEVRSRRVGVLGGPAASRRCAQRPGANEHGIGAGTQQPDNKAIRLARRSYKVARLPHAGNRNDPVEA